METTTPKTTVEEPKEKTFDLITHYRDKKTGLVVKSNPYRLKCDKEAGWLFERPPGSGYFYYANGELAKAPEAAKVKTENTVVKSAEITKK